MYVLRRTVGTSITIKATDLLVRVKLAGIDMLGACALLHVYYGDTKPAPMELGPGERASPPLHPDVQFQLLRLSYATHGGTPARVAEFGIEAPRSILIRPTEKM